MQASAGGTGACAVVGSLTFLLRPGFRSAFAAMSWLLGSLPSAWGELDTWALAGQGLAASALPSAQGSSGPFLGSASLRRLARCLGWAPRLGWARRLGPASGPGIWARRLGLASGPIVAGHGQMAGFLSDNVLILRKRNYRPSRAETKSSSKSSSKSSGTRAKPRSPVDCECVADQQGRSTTRPCRLLGPRDRGGGRRSLTQNRASLSKRGRALRSVRSLPAGPSWIIPNDATPSNGLSHRRR